MRSSNKKLKNVPLSQGTRHAPLAQGSVMKTGKPRFVQSSRKDSIRVIHREYIQDIVTDSSNEFAYDTFELSPTNATTFPWLAPIAQNFESSRLRSFRVITKSGCATTQTGKIAIAVDYDATDPDTNVTKTQLLNWEGTESGNMWMNIEHHSNEKQLNKVGPQKFNVDETTGDHRLAVSGIIYVATTATNALQTATPGVYVEVNVAELYFEYDVELFTPVMNPTSLDHAIEPQAFAGFTIAGSILSTTNLLAGMPTVDAPVINGSVDGYGIRIVLPDSALEWLQSGTASTFASTNTPLLVFDKDFTGTIGFDMSGGTLTLGALAAPSVTQYVKMAVDGPLGAYTPAPGTGDISSNVFSTTAVHQGTNIASQPEYGWSSFARIVKGTALRIASSVAYSTTASILKTLIIGPMRFGAPKTDLQLLGKMGLKQNIVNPIEKESSSTTSSEWTVLKSNTTVRPCD
jgi:hypothetical protein